MTDELKQWEYDKGYDKGKADMLKAIEDIKQEILNRPTENPHHLWSVQDIIEVIDKELEKTNEIRKR